MKTKRQAIASSFFPLFMGVLCLANVLTAESAAHYRRIDEIRLIAGGGLLGVGILSLAMVMRGKLD
jgi:hypothetical protein